MRMIGQNWFRLYSFVFTSFNTLATNAGSKPFAMISFGPFAILYIHIIRDQAYHIRAGYRCLFDPGFSSADGGFDMMFNGIISFSGL